ncbi:kinase-like domain-containing protein [Gigaspora rosea]|uniref:Kinase-like domain-containing protein n=1 Tax=Gigaspora rosea TaxID=44941 RepID=A0A397U1D9_9GLOM|nr:kinase-like domain-containing protein [Gigaspora rosea]
MSNDIGLSKIDQITNAFSKLFANKTNPEETFWLGYCYQHGIEIDKNEKKAFTYYQKSANMNNSDGMYYVGHCYYLGIGVEIDKKKAFVYYLKSAKSGNSMVIFKTAVCYRYGIGVEGNYGEFRNWNLKDSKYGKCKHCYEYNTDESWCITCDPEIMIRKWTCGNKDVDCCIKVFQLRTMKYENAIEWIPFDKSSITDKIGEGGFGCVYSATWPDGIRKIEKTDDHHYVRSREPSSTVALKTLSDSSLKEFKNHMKCVMFGSKLKKYGLTQNAETNEYMMVLQYVNNGNLYKFLRTNFRDLNWQTKLKLLLDISEDLRKIHVINYIHADFHSGNILQHKGIGENIKSYISDMGLSKKFYENDSEGCIYGVMPYVAPEVLSSQEFTEKADIYDFGVIMSEISTGQRPFDGYQFNEELAVKICIGSRPEFAPGTPECYIKLAKQCMDSDPEKQPAAWQVFQELYKWVEIMENSDNNEIKKQFLDADKIVEKLPINLPKHPDFMYTSKIINTQKISQAIKVSMPIESIELPDY